MVHWENEIRQVDLYKYYFIHRSSCRIGLSGATLRFHIKCLSKPHKSSELHEDLSSLWSCVLFQQSCE